MCNIWDHPSSCDCDFISPFYLKNQNYLMDDFPKFYYTSTPTNAICEQCSRPIYKFNLPTLDSFKLDILGWGWHVHNCNSENYSEPDIPAINNWCHFLLYNYKILDDQLILLGRSDFGGLFDAYLISTQINMDVIRANLFAINFRDSLFSYYNISEGRARVLNFTFKKYPSCPLEFKAGNVVTAYYEGVDLGTKVRFTLIKGTNRIHGEMTKSLLNSKCNNLLKRVPHVKFQIKVIIKKLHIIDGIADIYPFTFS
jgi:hypothetical protein